MLGRVMDQNFDREAERLKDVLKMAREVCHEMKQPLMAISGYLELLQMEMTESATSNSKIDKINTQFEKLTSITNKLSDLIRESS